MSHKKANVVLGSWESILQENSRENDNSQEHFQWDITGMSQ